jgi:hypothetical protein
MQHHLKGDATLMAKEPRGALGRVHREHRPVARNSSCKRVTGRHVLRLEGVERNDGESDDNQPEHDGSAERLARPLRLRARSRQLRDGGACHGETPNRCEGAN